MSYERGWKHLQISTEDYTKTQKFNVVSRHKKKSDADKSCERERNRGRRARKIHEDGYWVVYSRK